MSLFVAQHQHAPERCPAADPRMGPMLLTHLSAHNAASHGITIQAEAVVNAAHTLYSGPTAWYNAMRVMAPRRSSSSATTSIRQSASSRPCSAR